MNIIHIIHSIHFKTNHIIYGQGFEDDAPATWEINNSIIDKQRKIKEMKIENGPFTKTQNHIKDIVLFFNKLLQLKTNFMMYS